MTGGGDGPAASGLQTIRIEQRAGQHVTIHVPCSAITFRDNCAYVTHDNEEYRVQASIVGLVGVHELAVAIPQRMWVHYRRGGILPCDVADIARKHHDRLAELHGGG